ncbi:hypothetical protein WJX74_002198 [Apatococcus lobatus]|uniref:GST N-terminal domain-containing protein n=1 Tax=Apatococcus lobatus TaxID=904363 RepID=A0AAW1S2G3_9CHLO
MAPDSSRFSLEAFTTFYRSQHRSRMVPGPNPDDRCFPGVYFYHAHTYFPLSTEGMAAAEGFKKIWQDEFGPAGGVLFGKTQNYLAGPHTQGNFEAAFTRDSYGDVLMWLQQHRPQDLSILVHPLTPNAVADHTHNALWMGPPLGFNMSILESAEKAGLEQIAAGKAEAAYIWEAACRSYSLLSIFVQHALHRLPEATCTHVWLSESVLEKDSAKESASGAYIGVFRLDVLAYPSLHRGFVGGLPGRLPLPHTGLTRRRLTTRTMTAAAPITFYDLLPEPGACPFAQRAWFALEELDVPYKKKFIDKANKSQEFLDVFRGIVQDPNGKGTVPTIIDGDYKLTESAVVVEYLDKKYGKAGKGLLPDDAKQLGNVKLFVETFQAQLTGNIFRLLRADTKADLEEAIKAADAGAKVLNDFVKVNGSSEGGSFFLGSKYSYAETMTTPFVLRALLLKDYKKYDLVGRAKEHGLDRLAAWIEASLSRPSAKTSSPSHEALVETMAGYNQPLKD